MRITPAIALRLCPPAVVVIGLPQLPAFALGVRDYGAIPG
jgi:hypothetical protein